MCSLAKKREQERTDGRLARAASEREAKVVRERRRRQEEMSQREAHRISVRERSAFKTCFAELVVRYIQWKDTYRTPFPTTSIYHSCMHFNL